MHKLAFSLCVFAMSLTLMAFNSTSVTFDSSMKEPGSNKIVKLKAILFTPESSGPHPVVVLLHSCGGPDQTTTRDWPSFLTGLGYAVLSINSLSPREIRNCTKMEGKLREVLQGRDALGALDFLATQSSIDISKAAVMGFSSGAMSINNVIVGGRIKSPENRTFKAGISVYGTCKYITSHTNKDIPLVAIAAEHDAYHTGPCINASRFEGLDTFVLKGAYHAFDVVKYKTPKKDPYGNKMRYSSSATAEARKITKAFLAYHLRGQPIAAFWEKEKSKGSGAGRSALNDWLADSQDKLCAKDNNYFSEEVMGYVKKLKSDNLVTQDFTISTFKMKKLYKQHCA
ncbi:MAG: dienelactone hydrolase family protein [Rhodospirillaceae bacterium]|nr:dienelactone hydrolase family protein [Rhodospirillaceae bacterium]